MLGGYDMNSKELKRKEILLKIKSNEISIEEGVQQIKALGKPMAEKIVSYEESDIAIIGISGRFPGASNVEMFWDNLKNGVDSVTEIPKRRWDTDKFYSTDRKKTNTTYCKWGGVMEDYDKFDPLFFNISPKEAEIMDPQQRVILEEAWKAVEDAGYNPSSLSKMDCGVFVGATQGDYNKRAAKADKPLSAQLMTGTQISMLAARISYYLNLKGPNITIDTACSSSLVAVHEACRSIQNNESKIALAGGVNILTTPEIYIMTSKGGMLSEDGRCKAFDNSANGFIPSEGAGVLVLKKANQAVKDGDHIYGVIKGSAVNQDGKTNGITAPSSQSQYELECKVYKDFNINPETISYVEAHGTGTKLGDPIEVSALTKAFRQYTDKKNYCAIGSVKTNFGHALVASGVLSIIKVLLCMKNKTLVPSLHYNQCNEHIDFENSPFYVNTDTKEWKTQGDIARRAAVSSFGLSGTNCHLVIEEGPDKPIPVQESFPFHCITFTAKTKRSLELIYKKMKDYLEENKVNINNLEYTLNVGRDKQDIRSYFLVHNIEELKQALNHVINGENIENYKVMDLKRENCLLNLGRTVQTETLITYRKRLSEMEFEKKVQEIADYFVSGYQIDFEKLYEGTHFQRESYPVYQFDENVYWIETDFSENAKYDAVHAMLDKNVSDFDGVQFIKTFTGEEFYNEDHVFEGKKLVPGAAQLEMAAAAYQNVTREKQLAFYDVKWMNPILIQGETTAKIRLEKRNNSVHYVIEKEDGSLYSYGNLESYHANGESRCEITSLIQGAKVKEKPEVYEDFLKFNMCYGPSFQVIEKVYHTNEYCVGKLKLSSNQKEDLKKFTLHPALMDGIFQTVTIFKTSMGVSLEEAYLPFGIGKFEVSAPLEEELYVYAEPVLQENEDKTTQNFNIKIYAVDGTLIGSITDYKVKKVHNDGVNKAADAVNQEMLYFRQDWKEKESKENLVSLQGTTLIISGKSKAEEFLRSQKNGKFAVLSNGTGKGKISDSCYEADFGRKEDIKAVLQMIKEAHGDLEHIVYLAENAEEVSFDNYRQEIRRFAHPVLYISQALLELGITVRMLYVTENNSYLVNPAVCAVQGIAKTMVIENPAYKYQVLHLDTKAEDAGDIIRKELCSSSDAAEIRYQKGKRYEKEIEEFILPVSKAGKLLIREHGTYIITGGAGGLGLIFAKHLAEKYAASVVLAGRSELKETIREKINNITKQTKGNVIYKRADVSKLEDVKRLIKEVKAEVGDINGFIHSAGIIRDSFIRYKTIEEFEQVLNAKIGGLMNLDEASKDENIDFMLICSSFGGVAGNVGQCDYAYANSFMDYFMAERNRQCKAGQRFGRCLAVNWPLWAEGGMNVDENSRKKLEKKFGMYPLSTENGVRAVEELLNTEDTNVIVMEGKASDLRNKIPDLSYLDSSWSEKQGSKEKEKGEVFYEKAKEYIRSILAEAIMLEPEMIYDTEPFETYGIDSVMIVSINDILEEQFGNISKTLLFEYKDLKSLTDYFVENMSDKLMEKLDLGKDTEEAVKEEQEEPVKEEQVKEEAVKEVVSQTVSETEKDYEEQEEDEIAIIGVAGKYPEAEDLDVFWDNLKQGKDCIQEIPKERWDYHKHFSEDRTKPGSLYCKWGGFIQDADKFDALYFNVAPKEAEMTDPQERLFLETSWKALQDAGYSYETMKDTKVGVFVGAMYGHYELYGVEETMKGNVMALNSSFASIANRVSYFFNFTGPSIALDTMCSSGITALHLACQSIRNKECNAAIVGASNLSLHENKYLLLSQGNFMASDGRCRSFGEGGDGYVPGEGVGAIVVKSLKKAKEDGDHIYAVVKATVLNHGGKTNGYTVPNPVEQGNLIHDAIEHAGIAPESVSYIEAHGTGTKLGDPIELTGMMRGLKLQGKERCAIGSVKSNIGHLEAAAGIAAITKVLLMMKNKKMVPSIHAEVLNKNLNIEETPFYVQRKYEDWKPAVYMDGGEKKTYPRRAGISGFGAGGANGHVILEEYIAKESKKHVEKKEHLFIFSERNEALLQKYLETFLRFLETRKTENGSNISDAESKSVFMNILENVLNMKESQIYLDADISELGMDLVMINSFAEKLNEAFGLNITANDVLNAESLKELLEMVQENNAGEDAENEILESIAYTLQTGRDCMKFKAAVKSDSIKGLKEGIKALLSERETADHVFIYKGSKKTTRKQNKELEQALENRDLDSLARFWTEGGLVDWTVLYSNERPEKVSLPVPYLDSRRYWFDGFNRKSKRSAMEVPHKSNKREEVTQQVLNGEFDKQLEEQMLYAYHTYHGTNVSLEIMDNNIAIVHMQDEKDKNMYSDELIEGLMSAFYKINQNKEIKAVILTGYGHVFCMGGMQNQLIGIADRELSFTDAPFLYKGLLRTDIPVISAMQGHASGGGMLLGLYADITIMAREAVYTASFTKYGFTPGMGATFILPEKLGKNIATEMMYTARSFRGEELEKRGASVVFRDQEDVLNEAVRIARSIAEKPRLTLSVLKQNLAAKILPGLIQAIDDEEKMHRVTFTNPEVKDRIRYYYSHGESTKKPETQVAPKAETVSTKAETVSSKKEDYMMKLLTYLENGDITPEQASIMMNM